MISEEEIKKFEKHIGKPSPFTIGGDEFYFKPLSAEDIPDLMRVLQTFSGKIKPGDEEKWMELMDDETLSRLIKLIKKMVKKSYPELTDEVVDDFVSSNFITLTTVLFQVNDLGASRVDAKLMEKLEKMRQNRR